MMRHRRLRLIYLALIISTCFLLPGEKYAQRPPSLWKAVYKFPAAYQDPGPERIIESLFFTDADNGWGVVTTGLLLRTDDGGRTWRATKVGPQVNPSDVFFLNETKGWLVGNRSSAGVVLGTDDGGSTWRQLARVGGFQLSSLHGVWFADESRGWAVGEAQRGGIVHDTILHTRDGGHAWAVQYVGQGTYLHRVQFSDNQTGWAVGDGGILYTADGGEEWSIRHATNRKVSFTGLNVLSKDEVWVAGARGVILHTTNGGESWASSELPAGYTEHQLSSIKFINRDRGWVVGDDGAVFSTTNGGMTWELESVNKSRYLHTLAATTEGLFAAGNSGVILTRRLN